MTRAAGKSSPTRERKRWATWDDARLLQLRFCDLKVDLTDGKMVSRRIERLRDELDEAGLDEFRPHFWLGTEWFSPDGVPGVAVPFYLAHPRLQKLEQRQMLTVEGAGEREAMRILRHEAGHAIDTAYRLHAKKRYREVFGLVSKKYPDSYRPRPGSRSFVTHLPAWYAQSHPAEDFAETFAVWLTPGEKWRRQYRDWPAMRKLELVDELMEEIAGKPMAVKSRRRIEPIAQVRMKLAKHYEAKRAMYAQPVTDDYDQQLRRLFSDDPRYASRASAAAYLRLHRRDIRETVVSWTGAHAYSVDQILLDFIASCRVLKLRLAVPREQALRESMVMLAVRVMQAMHSGHQPVAL